MGSLFATCPNCDMELSKIRDVVEEGTLAFCPKCQFPLVLVARKYQLQKILRKGGCSDVYLAKHIHLDQDAERVIKVIRPEIFTIRGMEKRFRREVQITSALSQRNEHIVRIYDDFGENPQIGHFYVMEFLQGDPWSNLLRKPNPLPSLPFCFHLMLQLCDTMQYAHEQGVVHRDLKPDNLMLVQRKHDPYFLKVLDFGIAKPLTVDEFENTQVTQGSLGTPSYMSPEQCLNQLTDARTDIYSSGVIFFELLTGTPPFLPPAEARSDFTSFVGVIEAQITREPPNMTEIVPERATKKLDRLVHKALEKKPQNRFQSMEELRDALEDAISDLPADEREHFVHLAQRSRQAQSHAPQAKLRTKQKPKTIETGQYGSYPPPEEQQPAEKTLFLGRDSEVMTDYLLHKGSASSASAPLPTPAPETAAPVVQEPQEQEAMNTIIFAQEEEPKDAVVLAEVSMDEDLDEPAIKTPPEQTPPPALESPTGKSSADAGGNEGLRNTAPANRTLVLPDKAPVVAMIEEQQKRENTTVKTRDQVRAEMDAASALSDDPFFDELNAAFSSPLLEASKVTIAADQVLASQEILDAYTTPDADASEASSSIGSDTTPDADEEATNVSLAPAPQPKATAIYAPSFSEDLQKRLDAKEKREDEEAFAPTAAVDAFVTISDAEEVQPPAQATMDIAAFASRVMQNPAIGAMTQIDADVPDKTDATEAELPAVEAADAQTSPLAAFFGEAVDRVQGPHNGSIRLFLRQTDDWESDPLLFKSLRERLREVKRLLESKDFLERYPHHRGKLILEAAHVPPNEIFKVLERENVELRLLPGQRKKKKASAGSEATASQESPAAVKTIINEKTNLRTRQKPKPQTKAPKPSTPPPRSKAPAGSSKGSPAPAQKPKRPSSSNGSAAASRTPKSASSPSSLKQRQRTPAPAMASPLQQISSRPPSPEEAVAKHGSNGGLHQGKSRPASPSFSPAPAVQTASFDPFPDDDDFNPNRTSTQSSSSLLMAISGLVFLACVLGCLYALVGMSKPAPIPVPPRKIDATAVSANHMPKESLATITLRPERMTFVLIPVRSAHTGFTENFVLFASKENRKLLVFASERDSQVLKGIVELPDPSNPKFKRLTPVWSQDVRGRNSKPKPRTYTGLLQKLQRRPNGPLVLELPDENRNINKIRGFLNANIQFPLDSMILLVNKRPKPPKRSDSLILALCLLFGGISLAVFLGTRRLNQRAF